MTLEVVLLLLALVGNSLAENAVPESEDPLDMAARIERSKQACLAKANDESVPPCRRPTYEPPSPDSPYGLGVCVYKLYANCTDAEEPTDSAENIGVSVAVVTLVALSVLF